jgi:lambda family phage portal protein
MRALRARARWLSRNDGYADRYLRLVRQNVPGPTGFKFQSDVREPDRQGKMVKDRVANTMIEREFARWSLPRYCTVTGQMSLREVQHLVAVSLKRDGEFLVRKVRNGSEYGIQLQVLEPDMIDEGLNTDLGNGQYIRMGIEFDEWRRPIAYHLKRYNPAVEMYGTDAYLSGQHQRVPADEIYYGFDGDRAFQSRGVSRLASGMSRLRMLSGYEEAAVVNARVSAAKMGFFKKSADAVGEYTGNDVDGNDVLTDAEAGTFEELPVGWDFAPWDPQYPSGEHEPFVKRTLRGIASAFNVAYNTFANDLEGVNYSSIRAGLLDEREAWILDQEIVKEKFLLPMFEDWLEMAILKRRLPLPISKFDKFNAPVFTGRRWPWVDPEKDIKAKILEVQNGMTSLSQVVAERGDDLEDVLAEIAEDQALAEKYGVTLALWAPAKGEAEPEEEPEEESEEESAEPPARGVDIVTAIMGGNGNGSH